MSGEGQPPLNLQEQREPLIDIVEEDDKIKVVTELPGVEKKNIKLYVTEKSLTISVDTPEQRYHKELELPVEIDETTTRSSYKNGVLETIMTKKKPRGKGTPIKIE